MTDAAKGTTGPDAAPPNGAREPNDTIRTIPLEPRGPGRRAPNRAPLRLEAVGAIMAAAAGDDRDYAVIGLMHFSCLRAGEVIAARVGDVVGSDVARLDNLDNVLFRAIKVPPGKNMRFRVLGLSDEVAFAVTRCLRARLLEGAGPDDPLFTGRKGGPLSSVELVGIVRRRADEARERSPELLARARVTPTELRRTGILRALMDGAGPMSGHRFVCERMRSENISCYFCDERDCRAAVEVDILTVIDPRREFECGRLSR